MGVFAGKDFSLPLGERTYIMGILNVTPDSFSDGGKHADPTAALAHARQMLAEGADLLDIGGESTRPGFAPVSEAEELARVVPVVRAIRAAFPRSILSVDTSKPAVAREAILAGANIINDVTGFYQTEMVNIARQTGAGCIVMHGGEPGLPSSDGEICRTVSAYLGRRSEELRAAGIPRERICWDCGIGFGKTYEENLTLLREFSRVCGKGYANLGAASRKSVVGLSIGQPPADSPQRLWGTLAAHTAAIFGGADFLRVHDVLAGKTAAMMADKLCR